MLLKNNLQLTAHVTIIPIYVKALLVHERILSLLLQTVANQDMEGIRNAGSQDFLHIKSQYVRMCLSVSCRYI